MIRRTLAFVCSLWLAGPAFAQSPPGAGGPMVPSLTAATPAVMAAGLAALSSGQLAALSSALVQALPNFQTNGGVIPAAGLPFINASGFVVISQ